MDKRSWKSENKPYMRAMQDLRRSSASSPHVSKRKKGTRGERERRAIREFLED